MTFFCTLLLQLSSFLLASSATSWWTDLRWNSSGERWTWHRLDSHRLYFSHTLWTADEEERLSPNGCQAELGKGWGGIMSTKSTIFHQWDEGFSSKQAQGWPGLTSLLSLCFKDMALQLASEFLSKSSRIQLDLAMLEHKQVCIRKAKNKNKTKHSVVLMHFFLLY